MFVHLKKSAGLLFLFFVFLSPGLQAQSSTASLGEVSADWPGVMMQIIAVQRIPNNRLMVLVRIYATAKAPPSTLIGFPAVIPPNATKEEISLGAFRPTPFSLGSSVMIDEQTGVKYPALSPEPADAGHVYRPSSVLASVTSGQATFMSVQFAIPPVPPPDNSGHPAKQTVSLVLPKAQRPITKIPVPSPSPAESTP